MTKIHKTPSFAKATEGKQITMTKAQNSGTNLDSNHHIALTEGVVEWALGEYKKIALAVSFGKDSIALLSIVRKFRPDIQVLYINCGYEFPETLAFKDSITKSWNLNLRELRPTEDDMARVDTLYNGDFWHNGQPKCCELKLPPLERELENYDAWLSALRRDENELRKSVGLIEHRKTVKVNPIAYWPKDLVWQHIKANNVPYHPLYDKGFKSLGCKPCTTVGMNGQFERAGRWAGTSNQGKECGIHTAL